MHKRVSLDFGLQNLLLHYCVSKNWGDFCMTVPLGLKSGGHVSPVPWWIRHWLSRATMCWLRTVIVRFIDSVTSVDSDHKLQQWFYYAFTARQYRRKHYVFGLSVHRVRPSVRSFVRPDRSYYHNISRTAGATLMKLIGNIHQPISITWLHFWGQSSKFKVIAVRWGGKGIHVDAGRQTLSN